MPFMQPQIEHGEWYIVEATQGTFAVHAGWGPTYNTSLMDLRPYVDGMPISYERVTGYGARLSAPGYLDCTDWTVFDTEREAKEYLDELQDDGY